MTITDLLPRLTWWERPARKPRHPQHRAVDEVERQQILRAGADLLIKGLRLQLEEQEARHAAVVARIDERHGETVRGLERHIAELVRRLELRSLTENVVTRTQELSLDEIRKHCTTPVMPLHQSPLADPAHVPAWVAQGESATP
ncbi:hypothetical protein [Streptomyces sp. NBC_01530]|uniref:hypothetical protein n=1 Tax=Streptomyces sp. NBC_01530 TaxID=2903895 RepID=UPI00386570AD